MYETSSTIAQVMLGLSIPVMVAVFFVVRPTTAVLAVALGAEMFLPERAGFKIPLVPVLDKHNLPYLCILIGCLLRYPGRVTKLPRPRWILVLAVVLIAGGLGTALTNRDPLLLGPGGQLFIPGLTVKDGFYMGIVNFLGTFLPLYLGWAMFRRREDIERLLTGIAIAGLIYIPFALVELRMSPQWHYWIYGYSQHSFDQTIRWGGYRPMVFMSHGLALARFFLASTLSLVILSRYRRTLMGLPVRFLAWTQLLVLVACKSTGAIVFALAGIPILAFAKPKRQLLVASVVAAVIVLYPVLRLSDLFPVTRLLDAANVVQSERAGSLAFRFRNEDQVLEHTRERIVFGWGEYSRNSVHDEYGDRLSVLDGFWIIRMSSNGAVGFLASFVPLVIPVWRARRRLASMANPDDQRLIAGLGFVLTLLALDLIPNGLWAFYPFLIAGALVRRVRELDDEERAVESPVSP